ncbi:hypothetical protein [Pseudomonas phage vB_PaeM_PAO1_Ab17]|uniref:GIY-YIG nuclease family protein n=1 Tax=Pseudomonas phage vB_PaeM_PAO1_Ab17 TaxID=1548904 RepID=A0A0A1IV34_9CAUD|nr:hypothetical protein [Pseudomonas phage vB_PaeM_PAO1_Ab17]
MPAPLRRILCADCGQSFSSRHSKARFCSTACQVSFWRKRNYRSRNTQIGEEKPKQFLYLMRNDFKLFKIGVAMDPWKRAKAIANTSGVPTYVVKYWDCGNVPAITIERLAHDVLKESRLCGEWFKLNDERSAIKIVENIVKTYKKI